MSAHLALIIPCYNEANRLDTHAIRAFADAHPYIDMHFVNDGSTDKTVQVLEELVAQAQHHNCYIIDYNKNQGKAEAVRAGVLQVSQSETYNYVGFLDADMSAPLSEALHLYKYIDANHIDIAAGARVKMVGKTIERSTIRHYFSRIFATYYSHLLQFPNYDTQCGLKIFSVPFARQIFAEPFLSKWFFDLELFVRSKKILGPHYSHRIHEVPLNKWYEIGGSRLKLKDFIKAPFEVLNMYFKYKNK